MSNTIANMENDVQKWFIMLTVSHLISGQNLDKKFITDTLQTLAAIVLYHLIFDKIIENSLKNIQQPTLLSTIKTVLKVGIITTIDSLLKGKDLNYEWGLDLLYKLAGFAFIEMIIIPTITQNNNSIEKKIFANFVNVGSQSSVAQLLGNKLLDSNWQLGTFSTIIGFSVADIYNYLIEKKKNE